MINETFGVGVVLPFLVVVTLLGSIFGVSCLLTAWIRAHALAYACLALPNERSSHTKPTPVGGGLSFVGLFFGAILICVVLFPQQRTLWLALLGGIPVALVGWFDDRRHISAGLRLCVHAAAALWAIGWLGPLEALELGHIRLSLGLLGPLLTFVGIVWSINLYNFMDGIDGLAGGQAFVIAAAAGCFISARAWPVALVCWVLAAAVGGFLYWNWPEAKIFMGDVGSGSLGFFFAVLALSSERSETLPLFVWLLLLSPFLADATFTLIRRRLQGKKWYMGHRTHAYQQAVQRGYSHAQVTFSVLLIDLGLVALASTEPFYPQLLPASFLLVLVLLFFLWQHLVET